MEQSNERFDKTLPSYPATKRLQLCSQAAEHFVFFEKIRTFFEKIRTFRYASKAAHSTSVYWLQNMLKNSVTGS